MSTRIMSLCWPLQMPPTPKAVLVSLADQANDEGQCWPSHATISERTCLSRRAVIDAVQWLEQAGALVADRSGGAGKSIRYQLTLDRFDPSFSARSKRSASRSTCADAAHPDGDFDAETCADAAQVGVQMPHTPIDEPVRQMHTGGAANAQVGVQMPHRGCADAAQGCADAAPESSITVIEPSKEPSLNRQRAQAREPVELPDWLDPEAWAMWERYRRSGGRWTVDAKRLSLGSLERLRGQGHDPRRVIENAIELGWRGLYPPKGDRPKRESTEEHNRRAFAEWLGEPPDDGRTIDA